MKIPYIKRVSKCCNSAVMFDKNFRDYCNSCGNNCKARIIEIKKPKL